MSSCLKHACTLHACMKMHANVPICFHATCMPHACTACMWHACCMHELCTQCRHAQFRRAASQKMTWSSYKHWNTAKLLVGITPTGVVSLIPPLWTGPIRDKEIVKQSGLLNLLQAGNVVMAEKGFLIWDLLAFKKVQLVSPVYCRGPRLSVKGTTHTCCVASLHTHDERNLLKLKQFRILSGVIPLLMKPMLERIIFICAALTNLYKRSIK